MSREKFGRKSFQGRGGWVKAKIAQLEKEKTNFQDNLNSTNGENTRLKRKIEEDKKASEKNNKKAKKEKKKFKRGVPTRFN